MTRERKGRESCNDMTYHDIVPILFIAFLLGYIQHLHVFAYAYATCPRRSKLSSIALKRI
jgi:hypothetical protein